MVTLRQVHSRRIVNAAVAHGCEGDGLISGATGRVLAVRTADCLPVLIADDATRTVAALHAGWRGVLLGIASEAVAHLGGARDLHIAVGPGIGPCCFEVGPEVAIQFRQIFPERGDLDRAAAIDLAEALRRQFVAAGAPGERVVVAGLCTRCRAEDFHSWRRDRERAGRMHSWIVRTK